jgi:hypothetical protein
VDKHTARLRKDLFHNRELATEISNVLSKYELDVPGGMTVVWGPTLVADPDTILEGYGILINGIPAPELLEAAYRFRDQFAIERY